MEFSTKLYRRGKASFQTTIPHAVLGQVDVAQKVLVIWHWSRRERKWCVEFKHG